MSDISLAIDPNGNPILVDSLYLATVKGGGHPLVQQGRASISPGTGNKDPNTRSGNPFHDSPTGRFGFAPGGARIIAGRELLAGVSHEALNRLVAQFGANAISAQLAEGGKIRITLFRNGAPVHSLDIDRPAAKPTPGQQGQDGTAQGADPQEIARRLDAVRDAAREFDFGMGIEDAKKFLQSRTKRPLTEDELTQFVGDVRGHRINDLIDSLDVLLKRRVEGRLKSRNKVSLKLPKNWIQRTFAGLSDQEIKNVIDRLAAKGYSEQQLDQWVLKVRVKDETRRSNILDVNPTGKPRKKASNEKRPGSEVSTGK